MMSRCFLPVPKQFLAGVLLLGVTAPWATAQTNERIYEELGFRMVTPGARAIGMGKTFVGLADDATAAFSNPAGLSNLLQQEFSFEFQGTRFKHERLVSPGRPAGVQTEVFGETVLIPSFFSYALPLGRSTFSLFRNRVQNYREKFSFGGRTFVTEEGQILEDAAFGTISVQAENYGVGYSFVLNRYISLGGSFVVTTIDVATQGRSGEPSQPRNGTDTIDSGTDVTGIGGVLIKPSSSVSIGAVYYAGSRYNLETTFFGDFLSDPNNLTRDRNLTGETSPVEYVVPGRWAVGGSWRIADSFTILADVNRVLYSSQITDKFLIVDFMVSELTPADFSIRDVWEIHSGAEYRHYRPGWTFAVRGGVFTDPSHQLRFTPQRDDILFADRLDFRFNSLPSRTNVGATFGAGVAIKNKVQLDFAASFSRSTDELVISLVIKP